MSTTLISYQEAQDMCREAGQDHILRFWDGLDSAGRDKLLAQVGAVDFELVDHLGGLIQSPAVHSAASTFVPPDLFPLERTPAQQQHAEEAQIAGGELLAAGKVGFVLVAGGQGSRLGFEGPKGKYPVGPVTDRTLFGWHAARIKACRDRHGPTAPWYIMTSATNDAETRAYFAEEDYFGLGQDNVLFFQQRMLPALTEQGLVVLSAPDSLFLAPNGHGGTLEALALSGCLADAQDRGVEHLSYFQVDSPLARPADQLFLGLHALADAEMSSKVVAKLRAEEKVGVLGRADGVLGCIEYSDLPAELLNAQDESGGLLFRAGNIANHVLRTDFVSRLTRGALSLPWHLARKTLSGIDQDGRPATVAGVKFETFVFDALGAATQSVTMEVDRAHEFSPIKNAEGDSSPETCRRALGSIFADWVRAAGGQAPPTHESGAHLVEVDPCFAETQEDFLARAPQTPTQRGLGHLYS